MIFVVRGEFEGTDEQGIVRRCKFSFFDYEITFYFHPSAFYLLIHVGFLLDELSILEDYFEVPVICNAEGLDSLVR